MIMEDNNKTVDEMATKLDPMVELQNKLDSSAEGLEFDEALNDAIEYGADFIKYAARIRNALESEDINQNVEEATKAIALFFLQLDRILAANLIDRDLMMTYLEKELDVILKLKKQRSKTKSVEQPQIAHEPF